MQRSLPDQSTTSSYTRSSSSIGPAYSSASGSGSAPRPTLADIDLPPRRRLRDGTRSAASSSSGSRAGSGASSRASSVSSSIATGRGRQGRGRGRSVSSFSTVSGSSNGISSAPTLGMPRANNSRGRGSTGNGVGVGLRRSPRTRQTSIPLSDSITISPPPPTRTVQHNSTLIEMLDAIDNNQDQSTLPDNHAPPSSSSSSSSTSQIHVETQAERDRRFTAAEKGKGRALASASEAITISEDEDDCIQVTGVKRKIHTLDDEDDDDGDEVGLDGDMVDAQWGDSADGMVGSLVQVEEIHDGLGEFTCPVCFCEPTQAVMTFCGHILCADCLHQSLLAAIGRNPNPYPQNQPRRPQPKSKKRGAISKIVKPQPTEWTVDTLRETWTANREKEYEEIARAAGMDEASLEAGRNDEPVEVVMVLKGLWKVEGRYWVIEGECPVCRKGLPGGYGPFGKGIGGVIPLQLQVGIGAWKRHV